MIFNICNLATLFVHPIDMADYNFWLIIPLSVMVAAIYRTVRTIHVDRLHLRIFKLACTVLFSEAALLLGGWLILEFLI